MSFRVGDGAVTARAGRLEVEVAFMEFWFKGFGWEVWLSPFQFERVSVSRPDGVT